MLLEKSTTDLMCRFIRNEPGYDQTVFEWFNIVRAQNVSMSTRMLKEKGQLAKRINANSFEASNWWL